MSESKVKPCPFCGSEDISFNAFSISPDAYALCKHCNAGIEIQVDWDEMTEKEHDEVCNLELQKVWNRRVIKQPPLNENQKDLLKSSIDEIERVMLGNKSKDVNNVYLNNAIRFIKIVLEQEE